LNNEKKKCSQCKEYKPLTNFTNYKSRKGELKKRSYCNECRNKWRRERAKKFPVEHKVKQMAYNLLNRLYKYTDDPRNKCYQENNIECKIGKTPSEVYDYIIANFYDEINEIINNDGTPSIDRIDSAKHYEEGNLRIVTFEENSRLGRKKSLEVCQRPVRITYADGTFTEHTGIKKAGEESGISHNILQNLLKGRAKPRKDFSVKYI
jgi:hypothetical protein